MHAHVRASVHAHMPACAPQSRILLTRNLYQRHQGGFWS